MPNVHPVPPDPGRPAAPPGERPPARGGRGPDDFLDWTLLLAWARFVRDAVRAHRRTAALSVVACVALAALSLWALPKTYRCEVQILAEHNLVMPNLGNPRRSIPREADAPTRAASELIRRREGLLAIIDHTNLLERWDRARAPALRVVDAIRRWTAAALRRPMTEEDRREAMLGTLETHLFVRTEDPFVTIIVEWQDAESAYLIADSAKQDFLEERHAREVATIVEAISVLQSQSEEVRTSINLALDELRRKHPPDRAAPRVVLQPEGGRARGRAEPTDVAQLRTLVTAKRHAIAEIEDFRRRRSAELQTQLSEQRATLGPAHPVLVATQNAIDALARESPQLAALKAEEQELSTQFVRRTGRRLDDAPPASAGVSAPAVVVQAPRDEPLGGDEAEVLRSHVKMRTSEYEDLLERIDAARLELDTARAGFKHRYAVLQPGKIPKKPLKPKASRTLAMAVFAGLLLAAIVPAARDLAAGRRPVAPGPGPQRAA